MRRKSKLVSPIDCNSQRSHRGARCANRNSELTRVENQHNHVNKTDIVLLTGCRTMEGPHALRTHSVRFTAFQWRTHWSGILSEITLLSALYERRFCSRKACSASQPRNAWVANVECRCKIETNSAERKTKGYSIHYLGYLSRKQWKIARCLDWREAFLCWFNELLRATECRADESRIGTRTTKAENNYSAFYTPSRLAFIPSFLNFPWIHNF